MNLFKKEIDDIYNRLKKEKLENKDIMKKIKKLKEV